MNENRFRHEVLPLKDRLFRLALRITLNREDAEDIVQETMVRAWREMQQQDIGNMEAFCTTICHNLSIDHRQRREQQNITFDTSLHDVADIAPNADERISHEERISQLRMLLDQLPEKQRIAIQLRDIEGQTYRDIAQIMQITENDVKINIFRARQRLKEHAARLHTSR